ncbi:putative leader peptide [Streptomyces sp. NPDC006367]|uniref:putative leader peptide n=1 Tax=Streptomyces sp. NPDC006367 TaxID=3156759 RepID=UPI0033AA5A8B
MRRPGLVEGPARVRLWPGPGPGPRPRALRPQPVTCHSLFTSHRSHGDGELTSPPRHGLLRTVTDTDVLLWRRVHMDLVRYAGCVCRPSC